MQVKRQLGGVLVEVTDELLGEWTGCREGLFMCDTPNCFGAGPGG